MITHRHHATVPPALHFPDLIGVAWGSVADVIRLRDETRPRQLLEQPVICHRLGKRQIALLADPSAIDDILFRRPDKFPKAAVQEKLAHAAFGPGLIGTGGEQNRRQRQAVMPLMSGRQAKIVRAVAKAATEEAVERWLPAGRIDLGYEMAELALQITWATMFGPGVYEGRDPVVTETAIRLHAHPKDEFITAIDIQRDLAAHFERSGRWRRVRGENPLSAITNPDGWSGPPPMYPDEIRANALALTTAGHVATGLTMAWASWFMALYPAIQARAHADEAANNHQEYLRSVVNETLRLLPPGPETMRDAKATVKIGDMVIERGSLIIISFYALHRHRRLWASPDEFRPERFATGSTEPVARSAFLPFGGGPTSCTGATIAWAEMLMVLGVLLRKARLEVDPIEAAQVGLTVGTCIYPNRPLYVSIHRR